MKRIGIDFSRAYFKHRAPGRRITLVLAMMYVVGIALLVVLALACLNLKELQYKQGLQMQGLKTSMQLPVPGSTAPDNVLSLAKIQAQNATIQKLNLPWRDLLNAVESATPKNIALLSLEPDASKNTLVVVAESANPQAMLDYVSQLKAQDFFLDVRLVMHEMSKQDPFNPYRFQIEARWREGVP